MDNDITSFAIKAFLREMRERVEEAHGIAEAADACARVGQTAEGVALANKTDELIHDAETLLGMTALLARNTGGGKARLTTVPREPDEDPATPVDAAMAAMTISTFLHQARERLHRAVGVARAAEIRAATAGSEIGARVALDIEPALYEARTLVNAASLIHRLASTPPGEPPG